MWFHLIAATFNNAAALHSYTLSRAQTACTAHFNMFLDASDASLLISTALYKGQSVLWFPTLSQRTLLWLLQLFSIGALLPPNPLYLPLIGSNDLKDVLLASAWWQGNSTMTQRFIVCLPYWGWCGNVAQSSYFFPAWEKKRARHHITIRRNIKVMGWCHHERVRQRRQSKWAGGSRSFINLWIALTATGD